MRLRPVLLLALLVAGLRAEAATFPVPT